MATSTYIIIMAVCLVLSAYFSATETAFSSVNTTKLKALAEKGNKKAALACRLEEQYGKLISTVLIGNNIVNIAMASLGTVIFVRQYGDSGATISTVVVTVVVLIFGEISPKIRMITVSTTVDTVGPYTGSSLVKSTVETVVAVMFTMLLPIRMVESSRS